MAAGFLAFALVFARPFLAVPSWEGAIWELFVLDPPATPGFRRFFAAPESAWPSVRSLAFASAFACAFGWPSAVFLPDFLVLAAGVLGFPAFAGLDAVFFVDFVAMRKLLESDCGTSSGYACGVWPRSGLAGLWFHSRMFPSPAGAATLRMKQGSNAGSWASRASLS